MSPLISELKTEDPGGMVNPHPKGKDTFNYRNEVQRKDDKGHRNPFVSVNTTVVTVKVTGLIERDH